MSDSGTALWLTAVHEAGHAVVSIVTGAGCRYVTIEPAARLKCLGLHEAPPLQIPVALVRDMVAGRVRDRIEAHIMTVYAGVLAERHARPRGRLTGHGHDMSAARDLARLAGCRASEITAYLDWLRRRTDRLVSENFRGITLVADALLERHTLSGAAVRALLRH